MIRRSPSRIGAALAAWLSELIPDWLCALFWASPMARSVHAVSADPKEAEIHLAALSDGEAPGPGTQMIGNIDLHVPADHFFERVVSAPKSARSKLHALAELDLRHRTPFNPAEVHTQLGVSTTNGEQVQVQQWVVKRSDVSEWRRNLANRGMRLRRLYVEGQSRPIADFSADIATGGHALRWINSLLVAGIVTCVLTGWMYPGWIAHEQSKALEAELVVLRAKALALRRDVDALRARDSERAVFLDTLFRRASLVDTLRELTVALPDEIWVEAITYSPERTTINGQIQGSAADLVLALGQRPAFINPRLSGRVSKTPADAERFEITIDLDGG